MGVFFGGRCYDDPSIGLDALFSAVPPSLSGGCITFMSKGTEGWTVNYQCPSPSPLISYPAPVPGLPVCAPVDSVADGFFLGFLVLSVWLAAWCINVLRRSL